MRDDDSEMVIQMTTTPPLSRPAGSVTNEVLADMLAQALGPLGVRVAQLEAEIAKLKESDSAAQQAMAAHVERIATQMESNHRDNQAAILANQKADWERERKLDDIKVQNTEQSTSLATVAKNSKPILQGVAAWIGAAAGAALAAYVAARPAPAPVLAPPPTPIVIPVTAPPAPSPTPAAPANAPSGAPR